MDFASTTIQRIYRGYKVRCQMNIFKNVSPDFILSPIPLPLLDITKMKGQKNEDLHPFH